MGKDADAIERSIGVGMSRNDIFANLKATMNGRMPFVLPTGPGFVAARHYLGTTAHLHASCQSTVELLITHTSWRTSHAMGSSYEVDLGVVAA